MLIFNIPKENQELMEEVRKKFDNSELVEIDSLGADTVVQVIVPIITVSIPALASIIAKVMDQSSKVEVEWNGIKIKGTEKQVDKFLTKLIALEEKRETKSTKENHL